MISVTFLALESTTSSKQSAFFSSVFMLTTPRQLSGTRDHPSNYGSYDPQDISRYLRDSHHGKADVSAYDVVKADFVNWDPAEP